MRATTSHTDPETEGPWIRYCISLSASVIGSNALLVRILADLSIVAATVQRDTRPQNTFEGA